MDNNLRAQIEQYRSRVDALVWRGRELRQALATDSASAPALATARAWQNDCGVIINELSGGSKAHWLARSFSEAFLVRDAGGATITNVSPVEIVSRLLAVLEQALDSLLRMQEAPAASGAAQAPAPHRFDFVHAPELRPVLEQAYIDGQHAFAEGDYLMALVTYCGILEAIVTDALQYDGIAKLTAADMPEGNIADWSFETRLRVVENVGLIRGGCARLPAAARNYRELISEQHGSQMAISERDARVTRQVLHVVMRDLNPGR